MTRALAVAGVVLVVALVACDPPPVDDRLLVGKFCRTHDEGEQACMGEAVPTLGICRNNKWVGFECEGECNRAVGVGGAPDSCRLPIPDAGSACDPALEGRYTRCFSTTAVAHCAQGVWQSCEVRFCDDAKGIASWGVPEPADGGATGPCR